MTNRELDAAVAEVIFGWRWYAAAWGSLRFLGNPNWTEDSPETPHWPLTEASTKLPLCDDWQLSVPRYTTDPTADYSVLVQVRETWEWEAVFQFHRETREIWQARYIESIMTGRLPIMDDWYQYVAGDYSRAALAAKGKLARISLQ